MRSNELRFLKIAEYTSLAASVAGVVISTATRQVVYAAAPLSVSIFMNLLNRQRFEQQMRQSITTTAAQTEQQLSKVNRSLLRLQQEVRNELNQQLQPPDNGIILSEQARINLATELERIEQRLSELSSHVSNEIEGIRQLVQSQQSTFDLTALEIARQEITQLQNRIISIESLNLRSVLETINQLQGEYDNLRESTTNLYQRLESFASADWVNNLQEEILQMQGGLEQLRTDLQQQQDNLQTELAQLQNKLQALVKQPEPPEQETLLEGVRQEIEHIVNKATNRVPEDNQGNQLELLDLNLGIDFGTSFTKVCFRDIARERSEVVTFSSKETELSEALLPTKVGILPDGTLLAGLTRSEWDRLEQYLQASVEFIKMRLADLDLSQESEEWRLEHLPELDQPEIVENLCAYYLSRVIIRAQSWIRSNKSELVLNQKIQWSANVGVPVEYCDSPAIARFEKVLSLAWLLSNEPQTELFTLESLGKYLEQLRSHIDRNPIDCHAIPEISAAVWSFLNSREADEGFYTFFDVGDGTLDGVSFRYWRYDGEPKVDFYSGFVKPLGVSAIVKPLAQELQKPELEVKRFIFNSPESDVTSVNSTKSRKSIQQLVGRVVMEGYQKHGTHRPVFKDIVVQNGLSIFISGGGGNTHFYQQAIVSTHSDFQHQRAGIPSYKPRIIPTPKDLSLNGLNLEVFHRFAVAYGLSIPEWEAAEVRLPSVMVNADLEDLPQPQRRVRYEDTRDSD
jgi:predicted  nucleic acid-binding Zn-ribbon protein